MILPVSCDSQLSPATMQEYAKNVKQEGYDTHGYGIYEPRSEKTGLRGFRPGPTQTGLYSHRICLDA